MIYTYYTIFSLYLKDYTNYESIKYIFYCSLQKIICLLIMHIELILFYIIYHLKSDSLIDLIALDQLPPSILLQNAWLKVASLHQQYASVT